MSALQLDKSAATPMTDELTLPLPPTTTSTPAEAAVPMAVPPAANPHLAWPRLRRRLRGPFAEFLGVFLIITFGCGTVAQVTLSKGEDGTYQSITWGWGIGFMLAIYATGPSGSHLNPAVTLAFCVFRGFPWRNLPIYAVAQIAGAFVGAGVVYGNYVNAIDRFEGGPKIRTVPGYSDHATAGVFCSYPQPFMGSTGTFFSELAASAVLMFSIFAITDSRSPYWSAKFAPLAVFFLIAGIGCAWGWETGSSINMARDLGPRLMTYFLGYGPEVWMGGRYYFWVPMVAPFLGTVFGGWLYDMFVYTGPSPVNTEWAGLARLIPGRKTSPVGWPV